MMPAVTHPRGSVSGAKAWCSACHGLFGGTSSFDTHRGIKAKPTGDESQDAGTCSVSRGGLVLDKATGAYYNRPDLATKVKLDEVRAKRGSGA